MIPIFGNLGLLRFHALDHVRFMQIYHRLSKSIAMDKQVFKNNKNTIENIDLENPHTFDPNVLKSIPINVNNSKVAVDLINTMIFRYDDSSLCLSTEMVEISRVEARVLSLD